MKYTWDKAKLRKNIENHAIDFADAVEMFDFPMITAIDARRDYGEERWVGIGFLKGIIAVIVFTEDDKTERIRIVSVRKATSNETKRFKEEVRNKLGKTFP